MPTNRFKSPEFVFQSYVTAIPPAPLVRELDREGPQASLPWDGPRASLLRDHKYGLWPAAAVNQRARRLWADGPLASQ